MAVRSTVCRADPGVILQIVPAIGSSRVARGSATPYLADVARSISFQVAGRRRCSGPDGQGGKITRAFWRVASVSGIARCFSGKTLHVLANVSPSGAALCS